MAKIIELLFSDEVESVSNGVGKDESSGVRAEHAATLVIFPFFLGGGGGKGGVGAVGNGDSFGL